MEFATWLKNQMHCWKVKTYEETGHEPKDREFAMFLGDIPVTTFSGWKTGARVPQGDDIYKIAEKLGPETFDALGLPRPMPDNPALREVISRYPDAPKLQEIIGILPGMREEDREKLAKIARELVERRAARDDNPKANSLCAA